MEIVSFWIGFDIREAAAFAVARESIRRYNRHLPVCGLVLPELQAAGLYKRPTERKLGKMWDVISDAPMSTEFAISRFLVPTLCTMRNSYVSRGDWAIFMDCDVMVRTHPSELRRLLVDDSKAVYCVKHEHVPTGLPKKMDDQIQTSYPRKNWSSVMAFNLAHPANKALDTEMINTFPGRDLHRFCWLKDDEIGELPPEWNYLVGHTELPEDREPKLVHWTDGGPWFEAYRNVEFADEWRDLLDRWAS